MVRRMDREKSEIRTRLRTFKKISRPVQTAIRNFAGFATRALSPSRKKS